SMAWTGISGPLPDTISALTALQNIYAPSNAITGSIPSTIAALSLLEFFATPARVARNPISASGCACASPGTLRPLWRYSRDCTKNATGFRLIASSLDHL
ncbi:unnamed protein product, partial [Closterium sp. Yama58-4]